MVIIALTHGVTDTGTAEAGREPGDCPPARVHDPQ
jgi:hypothetical protein